MRSTIRFGAATLSAAVLATAAAGAVAAQEGVEGFVDISGSSTVEPISTLVAEEFVIAGNPNFTYAVRGPGTTAGFEQFCNAETDISDASRRIKDVEVENCAANEVKPIELKIGIDGLAVIASTQNDALECLNFEDLYAIFGKESEALGTWEEVAAFAAELGSETTAWPSGDIAITAPGDESGTWGSFIEITLEDIQEARAEAGFEAAEGEPYTRLPGPLYVASPDDNVIIDGVGGNPNGIGFVGFAFAANNPDRVRMIPIADPDTGECIGPSPETVAANTYPISRDLFIYPDQVRIDATSDRYNSAIVPFVDFYLDPEGGQPMVEVAKYVRLAPESLAETQEAWDAAKAEVGA
jgi:phosphate transport system substrate-binding protein